MQHAVSFLSSLVQILFFGYVVVHHSLEKYVFSFDFVQKDDEIVQTVQKKGREDYFTETERRVAFDVATDDAEGLNGGGYRVDR